MNALRKDPFMSNIVKDKIFTVLIVGLSVLSMIPLILILYFILVKGLPIISVQFISMNSTSPMGSEQFNLLEGMARIKAIGGIYNALVGSIIIVLVASVIAIPLGVIVGIYLSEHHGNPFANAVHVAVDMIQGIPSIIFGIVLSIWVVKTFKVFAFAGSIALALMMLPIVIKNTEETLKLIPLQIKEAAMALGLPYWRMILKVVLPAGLSGIMTGILVGVSRILGETAPLIFTAFGSQYVRVSLGDKMQALPTLIYKEAMSAYPNWQLNSWGASCVLVLLVLVLNIITKVVVNRWKIKY